MARKAKQNLPSIIGTKCENRNYDRDYQQKNYGARLRMTYLHITVFAKRLQGFYLRYGFSKVLFVLIVSLIRYTPPVYSFLLVDSQLLLKGLHRSR